ncbi:MAG TPA: hypothetical protein VGE38_06865 [Nocardioides sp.]|uniref:hypothetical protein n=1 Tax=Nocardioides sp. TaxID=35761 RepID=UPI002ED9F639
MRLVQANLGRNVSEAEFLRNFDALLERGGRRAVYALQEIDEADAPEEMDLIQQRVRLTHHVIGDHTAVPILVPHHLALFSVHLEPACKGLAKFTPNRVVTEAVIQLGKHFAPAVLNTHLPRLPVGVTDEIREQLEERRRDVRQALRTRAKEHHAGVWLADTNTHRGWPTIVRGEKTVTDAGIDKAKAWAPERRRVIVTDRWTLNLTIDGHNAHGARVVWPKAA